MGKHLLYIPASTEAIRYCSIFLQEKGFDITSSPSSNATHLLLPVPSLQDSRIMANDLELQELLSTIPEAVTVIGGNLNTPLLSCYRQFDLLKNEAYLAQNAAITAECALRLAAQDLPIALNEAQILILGWGRIGKCLAKLLSCSGCSISVAARKDTDLAMISALGFYPVHYPSLLSAQQDYRIIFNTVPFEVLPEPIAQQFPDNCKKIDLASVPGIRGSNVLWARGLPGKMMPESSGRLIANTIVKSLSQEEACK